MGHTDSKKRILITGASGFVGGHLVEAALNQGYEVWAGVRASSDRTFLDDLNQHKVTADHIRFIDLNYANEEALTTQLSAFKAEQGAWHYVIHNAGITKAVNKNDFFRVNAENTRRLLVALTASGCQPEKFVLMSSLSTYGNETDQMRYPSIHPKHEQRPNTVYGKSKLQAEQYLRTQTDIPYVILHPTGIFGPRDQDYFMQFESVRSGFDFTIGLLRRQWLTFIYVEDLATVAMLVLTHEKAVNKNYIIADGSICSDKDFGRMIQLCTGHKWAIHLSIPIWLAYIACQCSEWIGQWKKKPATLNSDKFHILKQRNWICDVRDMQEELGFRVPYSFFQRLKQTYHWYIDNHWFDTYARK